MELCDFYSTPSLIRFVKSSEFKQSRNITSMDETRNLHRIWQRSLFGIGIQKWEDNINMNLWKLMVRMIELLNLWVTESIGHKSTVLYILLYW